MNIDPSSFIKHEIFRPLATTIGPGFIVSVLYFKLIEGYQNPIENLILFSLSDNVIIILTFIFSIILGFIIENLGSLIEVYIVENILLKKNKKYHKRIWNKYLRLKIKDEIVGQRFLHSILTRFKFELSLIPTLILIYWPILIIFGLVEYWICYSLVYLILIAYLLWETKNSQHLLRSIRIQLVKGPFEPKSK